MKHITLYTLTDHGIPKPKAIRLMQVAFRYIQPYYVQLVRPIVLKGVPTTTTVSMRAINIDSLDELCTAKLIEPRRSATQNWADFKMIIKALRMKEGL